MALTRTYTHIHINICFYLIHTDSTVCVRSYVNKPY